MKKQFTLLLVILMAAFSINAQIFVKKDATGANNGTSWTDAYTDLQNALGDLTVTTEEIWIAVGGDGIYRPTTTSDRSISFNIPDLAKVYGGFIGTETSRDQRDVSNNIVILSGDIGTVGVDIDNSFHVVTFENVTSATILDGVRVRYGYANGVGTQKYGGGIYIYATGAGFINSPTITSCIIRWNYAQLDGAGIYIQADLGANCSPVFNYCIVKDNVCGQYGGGVYVFANNSTSSPTITNCIISANTALIEIGGMGFEAYNGSGLCLPTLENCIISGNKSDIGGGLGFVSRSGSTCSPDFSYCTITGNDALNGGGAIDWTAWDDPSATCSPSFVNCIIWGNSSVMYNWDLLDPTVTYEYCDIQGSPSTAWDATIGIDGGNNIDTNPYFALAVDPTSAPSALGDFRMHFASDAIAAGTSAYGTPPDLLGNTRPSPPSMGAVEYTALPGDWNGATDSDWGTASNWLTGIVATATDDVYLSTKATNMPLVNEPGATPAHCNRLELLAGTTVNIEPLAGLTVHGDFVVDPAATFGINGLLKNVGSLITLGTVSGKIEDVRYMSEGAWHLIATPVVNDTANLFFGNYLRTYDEASASWTEIIDETTLLNPMTGYAMWGTSPPNTYYTFVDEPNTGNQSQNFSAVNTNGWNLFGNPYPSSIDWDLVVKPTEMNGAVYYLEASSGNYVSYITGGTGSGSRYVPPMQGFWISASLDGTFAVGDITRSHLGTDEYYKNEKEISNYLALQVQSGDMIDKTYIRFNDEATANFDGKYDAYKLMAPNKIYPQIYTIAGEDNLSISQLPATDVIPLGFYVENSGNYTISIEKMTDMQSCQLEDLKTGTLQDLQKGSYTFTYTEGENDDRFRIHLTAASVEFSGARESIKMYAVGQEVFVKSENPIEKGTLRITDLAGRTLLEESINNENFIRLNTNLTTGVYIVSVVESGSLRTEKIIIN